MSTFALFGLFRNREGEVWRKKEEMMMEKEEEVKGLLLNNKISFLVSQQLPFADASSS